MKIRIANADDVLAMFELRTSVHENHMSMEQLAALDVTPETLPGMLTGSGRGWVIHDNGTLVAFAMADASDSTVFALFVRPGHESRGYGRHLMKEAETWLHAEGCHEAWLLTDASPAVRSNGFYRHLGWIDSGIQPEGQVLFKKRLVAIAAESRDPGSQ